MHGKASERNERSEKQLSCNVILKTMPEITRRSDTGMLFEGKVSRTSLVQLDMKNDCAFNNLSVIKYFEIDVAQLEES